MKRFIALLVLIIVSCDSNNGDSHNSPILGKWRLTKVLVDPGDGSGVLTDVNSDKTMTFYRIGRFSSNGMICEPSNESNVGSSGRYFESTSTIRTSNCPEFNMQYELNVDTLVIFYPCYEACVEKFLRVEN